MNLKPLKSLLLFSFLLVVINFSIVFADDFQDAMDAANRGDSKEAVRLFRLSAAEGNEYAQYNLGHMYAEGQGVPQNYKEAFKWFRIAAEQGMPQAKKNLGYMYEKGQGVPQDYKEAVKWYRLSVEQGFASAQYNLGVMYDNGQGVPQDYKEAVRLYRLAAEQGLAEAQAILGLMYDKGQGVSQDYKKAAKWYRLAAEQGHAKAQSNLGVMYDNGYGVLQDYVLAHMWFNLSGSNGNKHAVKNRNIVEKKMSPSQIQEAQRIARNWGPRKLLLRQQEVPCADGKKDSIYSGAERIAAYQFGLKVQQAIEAENVESLFQLVEGELQTGPRKKDVLGKSFDSIFTAEWKKQVLTGKPSCYSVDNKRVWSVHGFSLGSGNVWYDVDKAGKWSIFSLTGTLPTNISRPTKPSWIYQNMLLRPSCFTRLWVSGDNYEFYHERYGGDSVYHDFVGNIGKHIGVKIPLEPVPVVAWDMNISLAVELDKCSVPYSSSEKTFKLKESNIEITDESVIETCSSDTHECGMAWGRDSHTILRDVPLEACGLLIPHFKDDCVDIKLVQYPPSLRGGYSSASIYGAIKDPISKRIYIVPLVNLGKSNDALNYFDELIANLSLHGSGQSETSANEQATHKEVVAHKKTTAKRFGSTIQPSFDCKNANKLSEKKICANEQLAVLDVEMSKNYKKFASLINKQSLARKLKRAQIYWLKIRNNCSDNLGCLKNKINNRNNDLKFMAYELDTKKGVIAGIKALSLKCDAPFNKMIDEAKITGQGLARVRHKGGICKKSLIEKLINIFLPHNTLGVEDYGVSACHEVPCLEHIMGFVSSGKVVEYFIGCELQETCGSMHMELAEDWGISQTQIILEKTLDVLEED